MFSHLFLIVGTFKVRLAWSILTKGVYWILYYVKTKL
jgi:hypothetical protein